MNDDLLSFDERLGVLVVRPRGDMTPERFLLILQSMLHHPGLVKDRPTLWDFADATVGNITSANIDVIVEFVEQHRDVRGHGRTAVVAERPAMYGMMRVYERMVGDYLDVVLFTSRTEAERWLTLSVKEGASS